MKQTTRNEADLIDPSVKWIKDFADTFQPDDNTCWRQHTLRPTENREWTIVVLDAW